MFKLRPLLIAVLAAFAATGATLASAATKTIKIGDNWFVDSKGDTPTVTVTAGTTVKWTWVGNFEHTIRASRVPQGESKSHFRASARSSGTFKRTLTVPGTYRLYCSIHVNAGQRMILKVRSR
jgi:plastocyanin